MTFKELNISEPIVRAVASLGFTEPTEIQGKCIPAMLEKKDIVGRSKTGSGKTFAFSIPAIENIDLESKDIQVLILCPTRELAVQTTEEIRKLTTYKYSISAVAVYGGSGMSKQIEGIKKAKIVVGTPGRIIDHINRKTLRLDKVKLVVLDEADEMLDMGFRHDIETILKRTPHSRQTAMFSATMPSAIKSLMVTYMKNPVFIESARLTTNEEEIEETYIRTFPGGKKQALFELINEIKPQSAIVFCNTRAMTDATTRFLHARGINALALHGDMTQSERRRTMESMKAHKLNILVATDVAARGIDIENVEYIINLDIPNDTESYTHRIGRTGRAGRKGVSISIVEDADRLTALLNIAHTRKTSVNEHVLSQGISTFSDIITQKAQTKSALSGNSAFKSKSSGFIPFAKSSRGKR
ncbi:MAG: DEAD/DEAH box helicase [Christensenellaceae bacterium]|jgi:ATP-dependent RNA helicase DeaD|nr:DEAD/DEAH box helicase [Christensenellaceae bacterium]